MDGFYVKFKQIRVGEVFIPASEAKNYEQAKNLADDRLQALAREGDTEAISLMLYARSAYIEVAD